MSKHQEARRQKKIAKLKAKRAAKRATLSRRTSSDPTIRLSQAASWPVVHALISEDFWDEGIGYLALARQDSAEGIVAAVYLVDVYCLGVKDAFWRAGSRRDFRALIERMEETRRMHAIKPECLTKIVHGAVDYAESFGFLPHPDFRHAAMLLDGIDTAACDQDFTFGKDGKPFYIQGPNETLEEAQAISERIVAAGGHFMVGGPAASVTDSFEIDDDLDESDELNEPDESDEHDFPRLLP
jgi:hypothetical protein